jgi:hypothetical protein
MTYKEKVPQVVTYISNYCTSKKCGAREEQGCYKFNTADAAKGLIYVYIYILL